MTIGPWSYTIGEWATIGGALAGVLAALKWLGAPRLVSLIKEAVASDIEQISTLAKAMTEMSGALTQLTQEMRLYRETTDKELQHHRERWAVYDALREQGIK